MSEIHDLSCVDTAKQFNKNVGKTANALLNNGTKVDDQTGEIKFVGEHPEFGCFSPATIIDNNNTAAVLFANTINYGPVTAVPSDDMRSTEALFQISDTCVLGTVHAPYGIYVPFNNKDALTVAKNMIDGALEDYANDCICDECSNKLCDNDDSVVWIDLA